MKRFLLFYIILIISVQSCSILKPKYAKNPKPQNKNVEFLLKNIQNSQIKIKSAKFYLYGQITSKNFFQKFKGKLSILDDSLIKLKIFNNFGLPILSVNITQDSIKLSSIFTSLNNFNYKQLYSNFGLQLNYTSLKNLLLGNYFLYHSSNLNNFSVTQEDTIISLIFRKPLPQNNLLSEYRQKLSFSTKNFKLLNNHIWDFTVNNSELNISYSNFKFFNNILIPSQLKISLIQNDTLSLSINYKNIKLVK